MDMTITYPETPAGCFAKGNFSNGVYFEVPAVFTADGQCDEAATLQRAKQFEQFLIANAHRLTGNTLNQGAE